MKKVFVFCIGGTGIRVMKSILMLMAGGMSTKDYIVVPIIIDPHLDLEEKKNLHSLIDSYKTVYNRSISNGTSTLNSLKGFFNSEVRTIAELNNQSNDAKQAAGSNAKFRSYIGLSNLSAENINNYLIETMFSTKNLNNPLSVGFKGNPNVGTVVLGDMIENADLDIKNLEFTSEDTGYIYTKTYSEYKWKFTLDGIIRNISLYHSKILGRRTIYLGNREICRYQRYTYNFHYSFPIEIHTISITQSEDSYILKIDGIPFNKLLNEQKLNRFNIIRDIFSDKNNKINKKNIKPLLTYKGGRGNIVISNRNDISKRDIYKTNINSAYRENDIENDKNIINTSSKRADNTLQNSNINSEYYNYDDYNYEEASEDLSNKAIDGGDSQRDEEDEDEDEKENEENNIVKENNNLNDIFQTNNNFNNNNFDDEDEIEEIGRASCRERV